MIDPEHLSEAGMARREAMLGELQQLLVRRRRRRAAARWSVLGACAVVLGLVLARQPAGVRPLLPPVGPPASLAFHRLDFEVVHTGAASLEPEKISDQELIALLSSPDRPAGLIRIHGQLIVSGTPPDGPKT